MNIQAATKLLRAGVIVFAVLTVLVSVLYLINDDRVFIILFPGFLAMDMLFIGLMVNAGANTKLGYVFIVASILLFCQTMYAVYLRLR